MDITCPQCQQTLRVGEADAGKQARCPRCETVFSIPGGSADSSHRTPEQEFHSPSASPGDEGQWHLRIEDGRSFGPVPKAEMDSWLRENRITANCHLRRDGDSGWVAAGKIYPELGMPIQTSNNPFADQQASQGGYQPQPYSGGNVGYQEPHRGGVILTFGIMGIFGCFCIVFLGFGIAAFSMAMVDIKKMDQGRMDPSGRGMTQTGMVLGIVGAVLWALGLVFFIISTVAGA